MESPDQEWLSRLSEYKSSLPELLSFLTTIKIFEEEKRIENNGVPAIVDNIPSTYFVKAGLSSGQVNECVNILKDLIPDDQIKYDLRRLIPYKKTLKLNPNRTFVEGISSIPLTTLIEHIEGLIKKRRDFNQDRIILIIDAESIRLGSKPELKYPIKGNRKKIVDTIINNKGGIKLALLASKVNMKNEPNVYSAIEEINNLFKEKLKLKRSKKYNLIDHIATGYSINYDVFDIDFVDSNK